MYLPVLYVNGNPFELRFGESGNKNGILKYDNMSLWRLRILCMTFSVKFLKFSFTFGKICIFIYVEIR